MSLFHLPDILVVLDFSVKRFVPKLDGVIRPLLKFYLSHFLF